MPFLWQNRSRMWIPFGVSCQSEPLSGKLNVAFPSASSMNRASINRWHTDRAISFAIEKVVVVVVVTIRDASLGSGMRFDCENLSDPRLLIASSEVNEKG